MDESKSVNKFTILDWIGIFYVVIHIIALFVIPKITPFFKEMYISFGEALPALTSVVITPWFSIILGIICVSIFSLQWHKSIKISINRRRAVIVLSFFISGAALSLCVVGFYLPIFDMAGAVGG